MFDFFRWAMDPANAVKVSGWSFLAGILGTLLAIIGFPITGWQLWRTANATKAAANAVAAIKSRVATYDAVFEVSRASSALRETDRHLKRHSWAEAVESYSDARHALVRLTELPSNLTADRIQALSDVLSEVAQFSETIELSLQKQKSPGNVSIMINSNRRFSEVLARTSIALERDV
ncbi:hypothetical protein [Caulobacter segnis]|uniref:hypothetical protein n=1 Tax=Caulobacter segnis TaxID=88688 RepID=UPI0012ECDF51|nr:hypothetical protein [Caulobacter segnis]